MVIFSIMLMVVILFFQKGLMGNRELSWDFLFRRKKTLNDAVEGE
jgi:branched-chain amino acid transport system permease protein